MLSTLPLIYLTIYAAYKLLTWTKALQQHRDHPALEWQERDRLLHPEEYEGDNSDKCPQDTDTETYPACGNSQQPSYRAMYSTLA